MHLLRLKVEMQYSIHLIHLNISNTINVSARNCDGDDSRVSVGGISIRFSLVLSRSQHYVNVVEVKTEMMKSSKSNVVFCLDT